MCRPLFQDGVGVGGERGGDQIPQFRSTAEERRHRRSVRRRKNGRIPSSSVSRFQPRSALINVLSPSGLRAELRAEEEKVKEKDQERRELEDTVDVLRKELNKTEQARKDASIKVMKSGDGHKSWTCLSSFCLTSLLFLRRLLWSCRRVSWRRS